MPRSSQPSTDKPEATGSRRWTDPAAFWATTAAAFIGGFLTRLAWWQHDRFGTFGFDTGIFTQGTWLLSHGDKPYVTIRGLNLFGDHASYILAVIAPLYRILPDPKFLLFLQVIGVVIPAAVIYRVGKDKAGPVAAFVVALAYLIYPTMNHAALWQFHPETLAAAFLSLAVLAAHFDRHRWMAVALLVAMLCKEDVALVVAGFGLFMFFSGKRRIGAMTVGAGAAYFIIVTFVLIRLVNGGEGSIYTARLYGIEGDGLKVVLIALPQLLWHAFINAKSIDGIEYLLLIFAPMLFLPFLGPKWLLAISGPMLLNLASTTDYQRSIEFQYLATSSPFVAFAAVEGIARFRTRRIRPAVCALLVLVALPMAWQYGPVQDRWDRLTGPLPKIDEHRREALALVPGGEVVSAQANTVPHLANRAEVYEFPNPFRPSNWGRDDTPVAPEVRDRVRWVLIDPTGLGIKDRSTLEDLQDDPQWKTVYDQGVLLLHKE